MGYLGVLLIVVAVGVAIEILRRRGYGRALAIGLTVFSAVWLADILIVTQGWGEANGASDCWPNCSAWQDTLFGGLWGGALLMLAFGMSILVRIVLTALRS